MEKDKYIVTGEEFWNWRKDGAGLSDVQRAGEWAHGCFVNVREFLGNLNDMKHAIKRAIKRADKKDKKSLWAVLVCLQRLSPSIRTDQNVKEHVYDVLRDARYIYDCDFELRKHYPHYAFETLLHHDDGEALGGGDKADDGGKTASDDDAEVLAIEQLLEKYYPKGTVHYIVDNLRNFKNTILYLFDKGDWVLRCFLKEYRHMQGCRNSVGSLKYKELFFGLTDQDKHAISVSGGYNLTDVMVVHFIEHSFYKTNTVIERVEPIPGRDLYLDTFRAAYKEVRGEVPGWFEEHVSKFTPLLTSL